MLITKTVNYIFRYYKYNELLEAKRESIIAAASYIYEVEQYILSLENTAANNNTQLAKILKNAIPAIKDKIRKYNNTMSYEDGEKSVTLGYLLITVDDVLKTMLCRSSSSRTSDVSTFFAEKKQANKAQPTNDILDQLERALIVDRPDYSTIESPVPDNTFRNAWNKQQQIQLNSNKRVGQSKERLDQIGIGGGFIVFTLGSILTVCLNALVSQYFALIGIGLVVTGLVMIFATVILSLTLKNYIEISEVIVPKQELENVLQNGPQFITNSYDTAPPPSSTNNSHDCPFQNVASFRA